MASIEDPSYITEVIECPYVSTKQTVEIRLRNIGSINVLKEIFCPNYYSGNRMCDNPTNRFPGKLCGCYQAYSSADLV